MFGPSTCPGNRDRYSWIKSKDGWKTAASQKFGLKKDLHQLAEEKSSCRCH